MRRIVYTCDRCGREIRTPEENPMAIAIDFAMREDNDTARRQPATPEIRNAMSNMLGRDYCYDCIEKIASYMKSLDGELVSARMDAMSEENECLHHEVGELSETKEALMQQVDRMNAENERLRGKVDELVRWIADIKRETLAEDAKKAAVSSNNKKKIGRPPKQGSEAAAAEAEKPKRERKPKGPDVGKIIALDDAGWSTDLIAMEMHMDEAAVKNILKRERQKQ